MSELTVILSRLEAMEERQRQDVARIYAEMKADRQAADERRESDRAIFMSQLQNIFANGCAGAPLHRLVASEIKEHDKVLGELRNGQQRVIGIIWFIGFAGPVAAVLAPIVMRFFQGYQ